MTQCKDIPNAPILEAVYAANLAGRWGNWNDALPGFPDGDETPMKLYFAKMKKLGDAKLVNGCFCGCRGDYVVTQKGYELLGKPSHRMHDYSGEPL